MQICEFKGPFHSVQYEKVQHGSGNQDGGGPIFEKFQKPTVLFSRKTKLKWAILRQNTDPIFESGNTLANLMVFQSTRCA
jgi:hypothetical protein